MPVPSDENTPVSVPDFAPYPRHKKHHANGTVVCATSAKQRVCNFTPHPAAKGANGSPEIRSSERDTTLLIDNTNTHTTNSSNATATISDTLTATLDTENDTHTNTGADTDTPPNQNEQKPITQKHTA